MSRNLPAPSASLTPITLRATYLEVLNGVSSTPASTALNTPTATSPSPSSMIYLENLEKEMDIKNSADTFRNGGTKRYQSHGEFFGGGDIDFGEVSHENTGQCDTKYQ